VLTGVTLREHLSHVHFVSSNIMTQATFEQLNHTHPVRRLMRPFTYSTVSVNLAAFSSLAAEKAILHRAVALTWDACLAGFKASFDQWKFETPIAQLTRLGTLDLPSDLYPYGTDILDFWDAVNRFVTNVRFFLITV
jgi:hypothetical protein